MMRTNLEKFYRLAQEWRGFRSWFRLYTFRFRFPFLGIDDYAAIRGYHASPKSAAYDTHDDAFAYAQFRSYFGVGESVPSVEFEDFGFQRAPGETFHRRSCFHISIPMRTEAAAMYSSRASFSASL